MGKLLKKLFYALLICYFLYSCVYHRITHLSSDELEWVTNRKVGEIMYFKSQFGEVDTVEIFDIKVHNSLSPFNFAYFNTSNQEYIAYGDMSYSFKNKKESSYGNFSIAKNYNDKPIEFSGVLFSRWTFDVPLKLTSLRIHKLTLDDVVIFDNSNLEPPHNKSQKKS